MGVGGLKFNLQHTLSRTGSGPQDRMLTRIIPDTITGHSLLHESQLTSQFLDSIQG
jgi:hypothetical protein